MYLYLGQMTTLTVRTSTRLLNPIRKMLGHLIQGSKTNLFNSVEILSTQMMSLLLGDVGLEILKLFRISLRQILRLLEVRHLVRSGQLLQQKQIMQD